MEAAAPSRPRRPRRAPSRPARGQPLLAGRARSCSGCCFSSSPRSWSSGPSSRPTSSSGSWAATQWPADGHRAAEADRRLQHRDPGLVVVHDALGARESLKRTTASGCRPAWSRPSCSARRSCSSRSTSTSTSASRRRTARRARSSTASRACTARTCSIGLMLLALVTIRAFRGHFSPEEHRGVEVPGIYWHFVDVMWIVVYTTVYII